MTISLAAIGFLLIVLVVIWGIYCIVKIFAPSGKVTQVAYILACIVSVVAIIQFLLGLLGIGSPIRIGQ